MLRNNILSIAIQSVMIFVLVFFRWDKLNYSLPFYVTFLVCLVLCVIYILIGFIFMKNNGSIKKNIISTGSIIILGIVIWAICLGKTDYSHLSSGDDGFLCEWWIWRDSIWVFFDAFTLPSYLVTYPIEITSTILYLKNINVFILDFIKIFYAFMPSLLFCYGIYLKSKLRMGKIN